MEGQQFSTLGHPKTEAETIRLGRQFCKRLESRISEADESVVLALVGQLGAGKTQFTKGIVSGLGGKLYEVTSPTFSLVNEYRSTTPTVYHFDLYRLESETELLQIGWEDYLYEAKGVLVVEWADKFPQFLPEDCILVRFQILECGARSLEVADSPFL